MIDAHGIERMINFQVYFDHIDKLSENRRNKMYGIRFQ